MCDTKKEEICMMSMFLSMALLSANKMLPKKNEQLKKSPNMGTKLKHKKLVHCPTHKTITEWSQSKHMTLTYPFSANFAANNNTWMIAMRKEKNYQKIVITTKE